MGYDLGFAWLVVEDSLSRGRVDVGLSRTTVKISVWSACVLIICDYLFYSAAPNIGIICNRRLIGQTRVLVLYLLTKSNCDLGFPWLVVEAPL